MTRRAAPRLSGIALLPLLLLGGSPGWAGSTSKDAAPDAAYLGGSAARFEPYGLAPTATATGWRLDFGNNLPLATPAVVDGMVYIGAGFGSHEMYGLDAATGAPRWGVALGDDSPTAAVASNGRVYVNTGSCTLYVLRSDTGDPLWWRWLGDPMMSMPAVDADSVYTVYPGSMGTTHVLAALDVETGGIRWQVPVDGDAIAAPVLSHGEVYMTSYLGSVYRIDAATGVQLWRQNIGATSAPWVQGDRVFLSRHDEAGSAAPFEGLASLRREDGSPIEAAGMTVARIEAPWIDGHVQNASELGRLARSWDAAVGYGAYEPYYYHDGEEKPAEPKPAMAPLPSAPNGDAARANVGQGTVSGLWSYQGSRPTLVGSLAVATMGGQVVAVDTARGEIRWSQQLFGDLVGWGGALGTPPASAGGLLWIGTTAGQVVALDPATGNVVWTGEVGAPVRSQPAVVDGRVYVGTTTGQVVMIDSGLRGVGDWPMWGGSPAHQ